jgi:hypothetical protein
MCCATGVGLRVVERIGSVKENFGVVGSEKGYFEYRRMIVVELWSCE